MGLSYSGIALSSQQRDKISDLALCFVLYSFYSHVDERRLRMGMTWVALGQGLCRIMGDDGMEYLRNQLPSHAYGALVAFGLFKLIEETVDFCDVVAACVHLGY